MQKVMFQTAHGKSGAERAEELFQCNERVIHSRTDRLLTKLMMAQWIAGMAAALWISPRTWIGAESSMHWHVWAAALLGGAIASLPIALGLLRPGRVLTRHCMAVGQMLFSALLIHLTGGRIETHFHVFGSLAFLSFYRDWRVLITATVVVAGDHALRGLLWPQSVFGVLSENHWRWVEHAAWVIFEDIFLIISIRQSLVEMREGALRRSNLESSERRLEQAQRVAHVGSWEWDLARHSMLWSAEQFRLLSVLPENATPGWELLLARVHPEDRPAVTEWIERVRSTHETGRLNYRLLLPNDQMRIVHSRADVVLDETGQAVRVVGICQDITERQRAEVALKKANEELESRVAQRTAELTAANEELQAEVAERKEAEAKLESLHKQLMESSRQAGMAEVATSVLHNVGNVLNSVNISCSMISGTVRKSGLEYLARTAATLVEQGEQAAYYLANDPAGRKIPAFLTALALRLQTEQRTVLTELDTLGTNIDHIKEIVAMQQNYGKVSGVTEIVRPVDLLEDSLRMNAGALKRHEVEPVREYADVRAIKVEKHKVLQILVNVLRNAKYACDEGGRGDKRITVRIGPHAGGIRIAIVDNGIGIPAENLTRIFALGFTTRKEGHGYGLHSAVLAAQELGGCLSAHSDGPGRGATFTLDLPLEPPPTNS